MQNTRFSMFCQIEVVFCEIVHHGIPRKTQGSHSNLIISTFNHTIKNRSIDESFTREKQFQLNVKRARKNGERESPVVIYRIPQLQLLCARSIDRWCTSRSYLNTRSWHLAIGRKDTPSLSIRGDAVISQASSLIQRTISARSIENSVKK